MVGRCALGRRVACRICTFWHRNLQSYSNKQPVVNYQNVRVFKGPHNTCQIYALGLFELQEEIHCRMVPRKCFHGFHWRSPQFYADCR